MRNSTVLGANDEYVQQAASYGRMDALLALILYAVIFFQFVFLGKIFIHKGSTLTGIYTFCATGIVSSICIGLVFLFCSFRKQKLETVGFSKSQAKKSFSLGMLLFLLVVIYRCFGFGPGKIAQTDIGSMIIKVVYYLVLIGFTEEILIRGYIGTRMFGYFKNKLLSIIIVGIMWSLYHIPCQMIVRQMSLIEYISANWWNLLGIFILHFIFQWSYAKHNSIIAPTILHFIWNFV